MNNNNQTTAWQLYENGKEYKRRIGLYETVRQNERFYRGDVSRGEQSGFGLGLPIAATIAAEHKGTLRAESEGEV